MCTILNNIMYEIKFKYKKKTLRLGIVKFCLELNWKFRFNANLSPIRLITTPMIHLCK